MKFKTMCFRGIEWTVPEILLGYVEDALEKDIVHRKPASATRRGSLHYLDLLNGIDIINKSIVDVCSGVGNLDELARYVANISRIDVGYKGGSYGEEILFTEYPEKIEFQHGDAYNLPLGNNVADIVTETHGVTYHNPVFAQFRTFGQSFAQAVRNRRYQLDKIGGEIITYFQNIAEKLRVVKRGGVVAIGPVAGADEKNTYVYESLLKPTLNHWREQKLVDWEPVEVLTDTCVFGRTYCRIRVLADLSLAPSKYTSPFLHVS